MSTRFGHFALCLLAAGYCILAVSGCQFLPRLAYQPSVHNPFPQLTKVAIAPFFNLSTEPTVDGREIALAYFGELQVIPGFEVVPVGVVETQMHQHHIDLTGPDDARRLAQILNVDAVVVGAVTDYSPYYPPRFALQTEWYAANPGFHPIPPGYGLPWGTPDEEYIPSSLIFQAQMALAREQMKTQTPAYEKEVEPPPGDDSGDDSMAPDGGPRSGQPHPGTLMNYAQPLGPPTAPLAADSMRSLGLPPDWPDPRGFTPAGPSPVRPPLVPSPDPVLRHTNSYNGANADVTEALSNYYYFRDDARYGGWQSYLQRAPDFVRFCCRMHIAEMLTARGGAGETRVVWRWPSDRYKP